MTRSTAREIAVHFSYEMGYSQSSADELLRAKFDPEYYATLKDEDGLYSDRPNKKQMDYIARVVRGVHDHSAELDSYIEKYAIGWDFSRISRMASAILRVAMYEILYMSDIPNGAAINEALELGRKYGEEETVSFINGILGSFTRGELS